MRRDESLEAIIASQVRELGWSLETSKRPTEESTLIVASRDDVTTCVDGKKVDYVEVRLVVEARTKSRDLV